MKTKIRIKGLRKRWLINSLGPIFMVALLCVAVFSVSIANYYYTGMRTGLESKAKEAANAFNTYSMNSYNEYIQMARSYTESFQDKDRLELQFIGSNGRIQVSTYGVTAGLMPSTSDITAALAEGKIEPYMGEDPITGQTIMAVSAPLEFDGRVVGAMRYVTAMDNVNQRILLMYHSRGRHALLAALDRLRSELESAFSARICGGVSAQGRRGLEVRRGYQEARTACLAARSGGGILFYNQVSLEFLARSIPAAIRRDLFRQVFGSCPERERQELLETVRLYFQYDGQVDRMAQALYVHKNTCHYRLQKLKEKTGYSVHNPRESVLLCLCSLFAGLEES